MKRFQKENIMFLVIFKRKMALFNKKTPTQKITDSNKKTKIRI